MLFFRFFCCLFIFIILCCLGLSRFVLVVKLYDAAPSEVATYAASHAKAFSKAAMASPTTNETTATNATPHDEASSKATTTSPTVNEVATTPAMSSEDSHQHIEDTVTNDTAISSSEITATKGKYHKHYDGNQSATRQLTNHGMSMPAYHAMLCTAKGK
jgi:cytoskeletal protein RodZ